MSGSLPSPLLWRSTLRHARHHRWQTWLSFLGIMLGVMMVVAVDVANNSARRAFDLSVRAVSGTITHQIVGGSAGVPDRVFTRLRTELGIRSSAPGLSGRVEVNGRPMTLVGVDPISEATLQRRRPGLTLEDTALGGNLFTALLDGDGVVMSRRTAGSLGLSRGEAMRLATGGASHRPTLAAVFASDNPAASESLVFADIATAQRMLDHLGRLDSIDLVLTPAQARRIRDWLPRELALSEAGTRDETLRHMTEAFHINLLAMSLLSLLVAALLIYNTTTLSVLRRRKTLGIFRAQGVGRGQVFTLVLAEAGMMALAAGAAGVAAGVLLGRSLVELVTRTIDDLYFNLTVTDFFLDPLSLLKGLGLGLGVTLAAAALPAWHATVTPPVNLQHHGAGDARWPHRLAIMAAGGGALMAAGWGILQPEHGSLPAGFIALTLMIGGYSLWVPGLMWMAVALVLVLAGRWSGAVARMGLRGIRQGIGRTGLAVAALTVAVSVTVGVGVMVGSFRSTVEVWLDQSLGGDFQVSVPGQGQAVPRDLQAAIASLPGVADVRGSVRRQVETAQGPVRLRTEASRAEAALYLKDSRDALLDAYARGEGILVSESLAYLNRLAIGDSLRLFTDEGPRDFTVLGTFYDYTADLGQVAMHERLYRRWWNDTGHTQAAVILAGGVRDPNDVLARIRETLAEREGEFRAVSNGELRRLTLAIFDRTFAITNVLRLLAILVAFVGVLSALMALQLERLREFAVLRVTGMTPVQVAGLTLGQTALMGLFAGVFSIPLGLLMSDILMDVINRRSFGWTMQHLIPLNVLGEALLLAGTAAVLAGLYPARRAAAIAPARALREE